ncbi:MAG: dual specificity protein phosphatase family protein [Chloroflexota bacterium]|nr:MAG: dual specificity protein phosphatase family protein [Chloroflexota bacterium]
MDISKVTENLYIAAHPKADQADVIRSLGVRLILNMIFFRPADVYRKPPFRMVTLRTFDSIFLPIPIGKLRRGVQAALPVLEDGGSVLVYCREGRHRSVAMAASVLIAQGCSADDAMQLISEKRPKADPYAWHIQRRIRKFEQVWHRES